MLENRAFTIATTGDPTKGATVTMLIFLLKTLVGYREGEPPPQVDTQAKELREELGITTKEEIDYQLAIVRHMTMQERFKYLEILQNAKARFEAGQPPDLESVILPRNTDAEEAEIVEADPIDGRAVPATPEEIEELRAAQREAKTGR
ncbi:MAG: hypothetical protein ACLQAT_14720 [Candidatus Binataceae bacterium]